MRKIITLVAVVLFTMSMFLMACQQETAHQEPAPAPAEKAAGYGQQTPGYGAKENAPGYGLQVPGYGGKAGGYGQQSPGYGGR